MKRVLLVAVLALMISSVALADHIGVYTDATGTWCNLAPGFTTTATVVYHGWMPGGTTGARFRVVPPSGSFLAGFTTPYVTIGTIGVDLSIAFGQCIEGTFPMGTIAANWIAGRGCVVAPEGFPLLMTDCNFGEYPVTGGGFCVASPTGWCWCDACDIVATEQSTWGKVKSLYR